MGIRNTPYPDIMASGLLQGHYAAVHREYPIRYYEFDRSIPGLLKLGLELLHICKINIVS